MPRTRAGLPSPAARTVMSKVDQGESWRQRATRLGRIALAVVGCSALVHITLSTIVGLHGHDVAMAGAPGVGKQHTVKPGRDRERLPWKKSQADETIMVPAEEVWAFCQTQRRTCVRICATFFRGRASCTQSCRNLSQTCVSGGCFHWQRKLWRLAAHHQARYCVR